MNIVDMGFMVMLLVFFGLFFYKLYNIFSVGEAYDMKFVFLGFIGMLVTWGINLLLTLTAEATRGVYGVLMSFMNLFFVLGFLASIVEILLMMKNVALQNRSAYNAKLSNSSNKRV